MGLEMSIFSSPGWSEAGGPWVKPEQAMKKLVWSETSVHGPRAFDGKLPQPPSNEGPVRDFVRGARPQMRRSSIADSAVIAYRTPADEVPMASLHPKVTTNDGPIDGDGTAGRQPEHRGRRSRRPQTAARHGCSMNLLQPYTARALTLGSHSRIPVGRILASDDGVTLPHHRR